MSTITSKSIKKGGYKTFRTRVKLYIHSHQSSVFTSVDNPIVITTDVKSFTTSRTIKGSGTCSISLLPRVNYLNAIYPNDYVNLYVDRGDGEGWVRLFFGFVDRVAEESKVDEGGKPQTSINVACTDFTKLFDKTNIYFNPNLGSRKDLLGDFIGALNIGGIALRSAGVTATGAPSDMVINMIFTLLGAAGQFILPNGYMPKTKDKFRQQRAEFAIKRLQRDIANSLPDGGIDLLAALEAREEAKEVDPDLDLESTQSANLIERAKAVTNELLKSKDRASVNTDIATEVAAVLDTAVESTPVSFLDILDVFTFVEREAMDGYVDGVSIWSKQGSLMSFIRSHSNESVNEVFFDLRPMTENSEDGLAAGEWDRSEDEIAGNIDAGLGTKGIRYVPALVMREYPFSTIDNIDGSSIILNLKKADEREPYNLGNVLLGSIFSSDPGTPGRHVIEMPNINIEDRASGRAKNLKAKKHLDVAVINSQDVVSYSWGRSDHDHFNLLEYVSDSYLGSDARYFMQDFMPLVAPIHIARHGLRKRTISTRFARFGFLNLPKLTVGSEEVPEEETTVEEALAAFDKAKKKDVVLDKAKVVLPLGAVSPTRFSAWGWRKRDASDTELTFHHGVDLYVPTGTTVQAVASGEVVACVPSGTRRFSGYGNVVIIKHDETYNGQTVFSVYTHLSQIDPAIVSKTNPNLKRKPANAVSSKLLSVGKMPSAPIEAGATIGTSGETAGTPAEPTKTFAKSPPHLHFEIITSYPARQTKVGVPPASPIGTTAIPANVASIDPEEFFSSFGLNIATGEATGDDNTDDDTDGNDEDGTSPAREDGSDSQSEPETAPAASGSKSSNVDAVHTRIQTGRWALLNDHWYQHNLEYLSGSIKLHGAPEIRIGYRVDFDDKNLSFYVEGVQHSWAFPGKMETTLSVTRGQPNNPYPMYVLPANEVVTTKETQRRTGSRLGEFFIVPDSLATIRGVAFGSGGSNDLKYVVGTLDDDGNIVDLAENYDEDIIESGGSTNGGPTDLQTGDDTKTAAEQLADITGLDSESISTITGALGDDKSDG